MLIDKNRASFLERTHTVLNFNIWSKEFQGKIKNALTFDIFGLFENSTCSKSEHDVVKKKLSRLRSKENFSLHNLHK